MYKVTRLCKVIKGSNHNATEDNWFTSLDGQLGKMKLTYIGTIRKDKRAIPVGLLTNNRRPVVSTLDGLRGEMVLLSYVPKKKKSICLYFNIS